MTDGVTISCPGSTCHPGRVINSILPVTLRSVLIWKTLGGESFTAPECHMFVLERVLVLQ